MTLRPSSYRPYDFANRRHIGPSPEEMAEMFSTIGVDGLDALIDQTIPQEMRMKGTLETGTALSEVELLRYIKSVAQKNKMMTSLIGMGYHGTLTPPAIQRNILENPAWYTPYTPYQPEISQGRLEALLNFQTMIADLTGLEIANASLLDEATASAEAMMMARRISKSDQNIFFVDENLHPQNINLLRTRGKPLGIEIMLGHPDHLDATKVFGAIFQYPGTFGDIHDFSNQMAALHESGAAGVVIADPLALTLLKEPGAMGADIAIGSTQRFGVPIGFGGPHAAYMATRDAHKRLMPGRIIGVSIDSRGNPAYRLALQTREQHIRREKATSNICTAQALLAIMAGFYGVFHGPKGLRAIAEHIHFMTHSLARALKEAGFKLCSDQFFDTLTLEVGDRQATLLGAARQNGINLRQIGANRIGITLDESVDQDILARLAQAFGIKTPVLTQEFALPLSTVRQSAYMTHPVFHMNRAETEMMRYMRRLADRDLALDRAMIPLGSCTMKLNAAVEMMPLSFAEFATLHPFAPEDQTEGYRFLIDDLAHKLCLITGYDAMSMQPNSGAQGEYAGLLTIRAYHESRGDLERNICLIPMSAHGTNPASAHMVGWEVIPIGTAQNGDIDLADFEQKAQEYAPRLAATMITYPSTHGVFEKTVHRICKITHKYGGQVYIDGANMNAMVGLARPGDLGGDVSHLNLHKTFAIPHGGGGPGMGPIGVKSHLASYLPKHPLDESGAVSGAPFGSASILPIAWAYCLGMGGAGLTQATRVAILNANYIANRLSQGYKLLYQNDNGRVAHECIVDLRSFQEAAGIMVEDVAKRLIDFGFHAPTMSWPVAGTLMIEPTESETKAELDRFCDAMLHIREEIRAIEAGNMDRKNNPLKNAPHTMRDLVGDWDRPYTRAQASYPGGGFNVDKYYPPVNRVDNVYGDRHLVCTCVGMEAFAKD